MHDLDVLSHRSHIEALVGRHVQARIEILSSKAEMDDRLGRSIWGGTTDMPVIQLPSRISAAEIRDSLLALAIRGHATENEKLAQHAAEIETPEAYLEHLVLHEVAHIKHNWGQDRETDCDLWVYDQLHDRMGSASDALQRAVDEVLHYIWDPIGICWHPQARDEYQLYVPSVVKLLRDGAEVDAIAALLTAIAVDRMGLKGAPDHALKVAKLLMQWHEHLRAHAANDRI